MRTPRPLRPALAALALAAAGLGGCHFGRNVAEDCWIDRAAYDAAQRYRTGLRARNVPASQAAMELADARIDRARRALVACEDGAASGSGRPNVAALSHPHGG